MQTERSPAVLLLNLTPAALAGIDLLSFTTTPRFRGIKDLPQGFHFVFTGTSNALSVRHGIWFEVRSDSGNHEPLFITRWDSKLEALVAELDEAEHLRWRANIGEFWREGLTPYRQSVSDEKEDNDWATLCSCITTSLLNRVTRSDASSHWSLTSASSAAVDHDDIPGIRAEDFSSTQEDLALLPVDLKRTWRDGATGRERTDAAIDRSWALDNLTHLHAHGTYDEVIGELQFCFLMTLTLNNWSCFEQWKRILTLGFTCRTAVVSHADFFVRFIAALRLQLQHLKDAEGGLIDMADEGESLLKELLTRFRKGLEDKKSLEVQDVVDELDDLEGYLRTEYGWQFGGTFAKTGVLDLEDGEQIQMDTRAYDEDDESGEYAPQVVDLSPEQVKLLNIDNTDLVSQIFKTGLHDKEEVATAVKHDGRVNEANDDNDDLYEDMGDADDMDQRY